MTVTPATCVPAKSFVLGLRRRVLIMMMLVCSFGGKLGNGSNLVLLLPHSSRLISPPSQNMHVWCIQDSKLPIDVSVSVAELLAIGALQWMNGCFQR